MANLSYILFKFVLIISIFGAVSISSGGSANDLNCPNNYTSTTTMIRLRKHIFCRYDTSIRPVKKLGDTVNVDLQIYLKRIDFDEKTDTLTVHSFFTLNWVDYHILWKPEEFDGISLMRTFSWSLWTPDLGILNSVDPSAYQPFGRGTRCIIHSDGNVYCVSSVTLKAGCSADLSLWPYDTHRCKLVLGSWAHYGNEVNFTLSPYPVVFDNFSMNREWHITEDGSNVVVYFHSENLTYPVITYKFSLKRHSGCYVAIIVIPIVVLMLVTLMSYWMEQDQSDRMILVALDITAHFIFLKYLGKILPPNGNVTPLIVTFYRDSLILTAVALLIAVIVYGLKVSSQPLPVWVSELSSWVLQNRLGQIVVFHNLDPKAAAIVTESSGEEGADLMSSSEDSSMSGWHTFIMLLDFLFFVITLLTYFVLLLGFTP